MIRLRLTELENAVRRAVEMLRGEKHCEGFPLFAFKEARLAELPDVLSDRARVLQHGFGLEFLRFLERLRAGDALGGR